MQDNNYNAYQYGQGMDNTQKSESKVLAIVGLIISIIAFICCGCYCVTFPLGIAGIIIGIIVLAKKLSGKGMAIASLILSVIAVFISALVLNFARDFIDNITVFYSNLPEIVEEYEEDGSVPEYLEEFREKYPEAVDAFMEGIVEEYEKDPEKYNELAKSMEENLNN